MQLFKQKVLLKNIKMLTNVKTTKYSNGCKYLTLRLLYSQ